MNISSLTLRDLEYLVAVADQQHFGKAAESCNVSQPALSAQIRKVEDFLGLQLFERSNRSVVITAAGELVARQARVVLEEARKILTLAQTTNRPLSGSFRLGAIATLGPYLMPYLLEGLRKRFPKLGLLMKEGLTDHLIADLRTGALDAVLAAPTFADDGLKLIPLFHEPFLLAAPKAHELASKEPLRVKDLHSEDMVLLEDGHCLRDQIVEVCRSMSVEPAWKFSRVPCHQPRNAAAPRRVRLWVHSDSAARNCNPRSFEEPGELSAICGQACGSRDRAGLPRTLRTHGGHRCARGFHSRKPSRWRDAALMVC